MLVDASNLSHVRQFVSDEVDIYCVSDTEINRIIGFHFHRGVLACAYREPKDSLLETLEPGALPRTIVSAVGIADPANLGGSLRNAAAFGVTHVVLGPTCTDAFSRRVVRVSMGNLFNLTIVKSEDLESELQVLHTSYGYERIATVLDADAEPLMSVQHAERVALLFGSEGQGIHARLKSLCDRRTTIPMQLDTDSFNVASASAVFMYAFENQS